MPEKAYPARCPVCHVEFTYMADFVSCGQYADGRLRLSCGKHTGPEIAAAFGKPLTARDRRAAQRVLGKP